MGPKKRGPVTRISQSGKELHLDHLGADMEEIDPSRTHLLAELTPMSSKVTGSQQTLARYLLTTWTFGSPMFPQRTEANGLSLGIGVCGCLSCPILQRSVLRIDNLGKDRIAGGI